MAFCGNCGKELNEGQKFCPECGKEVGVESIVETVEVDQKPVPKVFTIFGKIGFGLGIATIAMCLLPIFSIISLETGVAGIVFSCLGKKDPSLAKKTKLGFVLSLVGTIVGFIMFIVWEVVLGLGMAEMYY